jgi:hypothetical protein
MSALVDVEDDFEDKAPVFGCQTPPSPAVARYGVGRAGAGAAVSGGGARIALGSGIAHGMAGCADHPFELLGLAFGAPDLGLLFCASNQNLKKIVAFHALEFVDRHSGLLKKSLPPPALAAAEILYPSASVPQQKRHG